FHGNFEAARRVVDAFIAGGGDKLVILGDIYYHGARNPLPENYSPVRLANLLNSIKDKVVAIKGNCDSEVDETVSEFKFYKSYTMANLGKTYLFTHGHQINATKPPELAEGSVVFHGHFHQHTDTVKRGIRYINPGSAGLPFDGERGYLVLDGEEITWQAI
ncbi:MAG TPA: phosphodiesterase, partial [Eubacteriales bacterium]|nr:phosphodiesterase [Eubacteriales bacterium]